MFTKEEILNTIDSLHPYKVLPSFELSSESFITSRVTLFGDSTRWAIVIEEVHPTQGGDLILYHFGNCVINQEKQGNSGQYLSNTSFFRLISQEEFARIVIGKYHSLISKKATQVKVRDTFVPLEHNLQVYKGREIPIIDYLNPEKHVDYVAMLRYVDDEHPELLKATDEELRCLLPEDLPKLFVIDSWHFEDFQLLPTALEDAYQPSGQKPSRYETFPLIADILVSKDISKWKPSMEPNNYWRYWIDKEAVNPKL